jgi:hypothetical protein
VKFFGLLGMAVGIRSQQLVWCTVIRLFNFRQCGLAALLAMSHLTKR